MPTKFDHHHPAPPAMPALPVIGWRLKKTEATSFKTAPVKPRRVAPTLFNQCTNTANPSNQFMQDTIPNQLFNATNVFESPRTKHCNDTKSRNSAMLATMKIQEIKICCAWWGTCFAMADQPDSLPDRGKDWQSSEAMLPTCK
eukprot:CAMPEP_0169117170 /NCGR_PEP_ID=MMETSP1015-20121227/30313_1 /TAXON_ID=342587 /ORGANISM="Karlodinium micrum, Strain CCMP2283" /LENGTH=142 /DNA_ID=CAMNT_0009179831 /DNA_START=341 /DNA_END=769 /DNA_ORIENTATION=+